MRKRGKAVAAALLILCVLAGLGMLAGGIADTVHLRRTTAHYQRTQGYLTDVQPYTTHREQPSYQLFYAYTVAGQSYTVATDYGVAAAQLPAPGSTHSILYDPQQPARSVVDGPNHTHLLVLVGLLFISVPGIFLLFLFLSTERGSHVRQTSIDRCIGVIFIVLALGIFYAQAGTLSPRAILASFNLWMLVPLLFIAVGVLCLARGLFKQPPQ